ALECQPPVGAPDAIEVVADVRNQDRVLPLEAREHAAVAGVCVNQVVLSRHDVESKHPQRSAYVRTPASVTGYDGNIDLDARIFDRLHLHRGERAESRSLGGRPHVRQREYTQPRAARGDHDVRRKTNWLFPVPRGSVVRTLTTSIPHSARQNSTIS